MKVNDFLKMLSEELELESAIEIDTDLTSFSEWDSMAVMVVISLVSTNFGVVLTGNDLENVTYVRDLIELIGRESFS